MSVEREICHSVFANLDLGAHKRYKASVGHVSQYVFVVFSWKWKMRTRSMYSSSRREEPAKDAHLHFHCGSGLKWKRFWKSNRFKLIAFFNHPKTSFLQCSP